MTEGERAREVGREAERLQQLMAPAFEQGERGGGGGRESERDRGKEKGRGRGMER